MENMVKGLTVLKWLLMNRCPAIYLPKLSAQAQKFGILMKKGFIERLKSVVVNIGFKTTKVKSYTTYKWWKGCDICTNLHLGIARGYMSSVFECLVNYKLKWSLYYHLRKNSEILNYRYHLECKNITFIIFIIMMTKLI
jgi:hypothetical protein